MSAAPRSRLLLPGVLLASTVVVATAFDPAPHSGGDNSGYLSLAYGLLADGAYTDAFDPEGLPHTKYPPVFPMLLAALMGLGARSWVAFKATASVATVAAVGLTYLWARRRLGDVAALTVALLLAVSSAVVYYSHWILSDPMFVALTMGALLSLERASEDDAAAKWLAPGIVAAGLAYFTRQAGLPLVVALLVWLGLRRRWRALGVAAVAIGAPALVWWWRGRGVAVASYADEFWMVNPYDPSLGTVGIGGLLPRALSNLGSYVLSHGPSGIVGQGPPVIALLGVALLAAATVGWALSVRERVRPAELFLPLYGGLILLWPEVWAGDRFVLPLYPLLFVYGAVALRALGGRMPEPTARLVTVAAILLVVLPATRSWIRDVGAASACAATARTPGTLACYGAGVEAFAAAAAWSASALPEGSAVLSRKPRHFYVHSGVPSRTFPFSDEPAELLALADRVGARYVLLDRWDGLAARYLGGAISRQPDAFCFVGEAADDGVAELARLFAIRPPSERGVASPDADPRAQIASCPAGYVLPTESRTYSPTSSGSPRVPLLAGLDS